MAILEDKKLKRHIETEQLSPLYILYGDEKMLLRNSVAKLSKKAKGDAFPDFNFNEFTDESSVDAIADAVCNLPFMAEMKCVLVSDFNIETKKEVEISKLKELFQSLPDTTVLIFSYPTLNFDGKKAKKWRDFLKLGDKAGINVQFNPRDSKDIVKFLVTKAEKNNASLSPRLAEKIVENVGNNLTTLSGEIQKLSSYCSGREITEKDVEDLVTKNLKAKVFDLSKSIINKNYSKAYEILDTLLYNDEKSINILAALSSAYIDMYRVRVALQSGKKATAPSEYGKYKGREFTLTNAERSIRNLPENALRESLDILLEADILLKSSKISDKEVLESVIAKLLLVAN